MKTELDGPLPLEMRWINQRRDEGICIVSCELLVSNGDSHELSKCRSGTGDATKKKIWVESCDGNQAVRWRYFRLRFEAIDVRRCPRLRQQQLSPAGSGFVAPRHYTPPPPPPPLARIMSRCDGTRHVSRHHQVPPSNLLLPAPLRPQ